MGTHSLRAGSSILSVTGVFILITLAVAHSTRELLVGINEAGHRGRKFVVGGGEGCIGLHQLSQKNILHGSCRSEGVEIFVEVGIRPVLNICLIFLIWFRLLPKCDVSGAKLVLDSHGLLLDLGLPVCCFVHLFQAGICFLSWAGTPRFLSLGGNTPSKASRLLK